MEQTKKIIGSDLGEYLQVHKVYKPEITRNSEIFERREVKSRNTSTVKTNVIGRARIICFFAVVSLLAFLFIYNFIAISNLNLSIANMESSIVAEQDYINNLKAEINSISQDDAIMERVNALGFDGEISTNDNILMVNVDKVTITESVAQSNWFNDFCNFVSSVFGG
mgnify:CR=1 FL=1